MSIESTILLSNIIYDNNDVAPTDFSYSDKGKGAGYHKNDDGVHTVVYHLNDFKGTVKMQATLALQPAPADWIDVVGTEIGGDSTVINAAVKTITFTGKFVWVRAAYKLEQGTITEIRYNH